MRGYVTRLDDAQQAGTIAGEDGTEYVFGATSLFATTFSAVHPGVRVTFEASPMTRRAFGVCLFRMDEPSR